MTSFYICNQSRSDERSGPVSRSVAVQRLFQNSQRFPHFYKRCNPLIQLFPRMSR